MPTKSYVNIDYGTNTKPINVPDPVNAQDVSTRHFLMAQAATLAAMPAPVTSGSGIQTFTDVMGDVWVAANGVNSGNWRRARDVLHSRVYRNAAVNVTTTNTLLTCDTVTRDTYSLYNISTGVMTAPVPALYLVTASVKYVIVTAGDWLLITFQVNGTTVSNRVDITSTKNPAESQQAFLTDRVYMNAGDTFRLLVQSDATLAIGTGTTNTFLDIDFFGQG